MRPSELRRALDRFRAGVLYHDPAAIRAVVRFPIQAGVSDSTATNAAVTKVTIRNASEWFAFQEKHFSKAHTALVACAYLGNVTPTGRRSPGVMIGLGAFWFQSFVGSWAVKMTSVNLFPVDATMLAKACTPPGLRETNTLGGVKRGCRTLTGPVGGRELNVRQRHLRH